MSLCDKIFKQIFFHYNNIYAVVNIAIIGSVEAHFGDSAVFINLIKAKNRADFIRHRSFNAHNGDVSAGFFMRVKQLFVIERKHIVAIAHHNIGLVALLQKAHVAENGVYSVAPHGGCAHIKGRQNEKTVVFAV